VTTVAVTGATGLIGRHLVAALHDRGDEVVALSRRDQVVAGVATAPWNPQDDELPDAARCAAAVVNLAGIGIADGRWGAAHRRLILESRLTVTRRVVDALPGGPDVLVSGSAIGYYGPGDEAVDESSSAGGDFLADVCRRWELEAQRGCDLGAQVVLLRSGIVLARDGGALPKLLRPARLGVGGPLGSGRQWMSWIHIADEIGAILHCLDNKSVVGAVNVVAPTPVHQKEFARALGHALHRPAVVRAPSFALRLLLGGAAEMALTGQRVVPARLTSSGYVHRFALLDSALGDLFKDRGSR
jgi:uncharacterized protein